MVSWQTYLVSAYLIVGHLPQRFGSSHQGIVPYQSFQASDGYFNLAVANDLLWAKFCDALDSIHAGEKWYRSVEYSTNNKRVQAREQLIGQLTPLFRSRPRCFWLDLFQHAGIPAGSIDSIAEVVHNPQVVARHLFEYVEHPTLGTIPTVRTPITFSDMSTVPPVAPPLLGADTAAVLQDLGYNDKAKKGDIL